MRNLVDWVNAGNGDITTATQDDKLSVWMCFIVRLPFVVILAVAFGVLCCCESSSPPPVMLPPSPLTNRIQPADPSKYVTYEDVPWNEWKNPRLIVPPRG